MKITRYHIILLFVFLFGNSCKKGGRVVNEGRIVYNISYPNLAKDELIKAILPEQMEIFFKENNTISSIEGSMGLFKMAQIYNADRNKYSTLLKIWNKRYMYEIKADKSKPDFGILKNLKIELTEGSKEIAGYNCKRALAYLKGQSNPLELYYTDEILIDEPNAHNPYTEIKGVLLEFYLYINDIQMHLLADRIENTVVDSTSFLIPPGYKPVTKREMEKIISKLSPTK